MRIFGQRLAEERKRLGFNQTDFGKIGGVTKTSQVNYEAGERSPDVDYWEAVANAGVDVGYILTGARTPDLPRQLRMARGDLSIEEFARMLDVTPETLAQVEAGAYPVMRDLFQRVIERIPGVDPMALMGQPQSLEGELSYDEKVLVGNYRDSSAEDQEILRRLAASSAKRQPRAISEAP